MEKKSKGKSWEQEPSVQAVRKGKEAILELIGDDVSRIVMSRDGDDYSLLPIAVCEGNKDMVQLLLDRGASVHLKDRDHWSLHLAAVEGHEEILKLLIQKTRTPYPYARLDFNKHFRDGNGKTLLHSAVTKNINIVKFLLDLGADINATDNGKRCVLLMAMRAEQEEIVKLLLERGCRVNFNFWDNKDCKLLHEAAKIGNTAIFKLLLDRGEIDVNEQNRDKQTALHFACEKGNKDIVRMLIERGAQVNDTADKTGSTMLDYAARGGNTDVFKLIINHGIKKTKATVKKYNTALLIACRQGHEEMVKFLIDGGAQVNGWNCPLWYTAFQSGNVNLIVLLMDYGCDINERYGLKPLQFLLYAGHHIETLKSIIERGADINDPNGFYMILHEVVKNEDRNMLEYLIQKGSDINIKNYQGWTVLHEASKSGYNEVVEFLVEKGAEIDAENNSGNTPLLLACQYNNEATVQLLVEYGASIEVNDGNNKNFVEQLLSDKPSSEILVRLAVRMKSQKLPVSPKIFEVIEKNNKMRAYKVKCEEELESMRSDDSKFAFWGLLMSNNRCLAGFARNEELIKLLKSDECKTKFPIYSSLLKNQMKRRIWRKTLLDKVKYFFKAVGKSEGNDHLPKLPILCVREILSYFSNTDLKSLIKVCNPHNDFDLKMNEML